jgi:hypothetical protein
MVQNSPFVYIYLGVCVSLHTRIGLNVLLCFRDSSKKQNASYLLSNQTSNQLRRVISSGKLLRIVRRKSMDVSDEGSKNKSSRKPASKLCLPYAFALNCVYTYSCLNDTVTLMSSSITGSSLRDPTE